VQIEPENLQAWTSRGLAYERLGNSERAVGSYAKALSINQNFAPAKSGFTRVGGKFGQTYQSF
jgi:Tfp pilus assembly protein PilF